MSDLNLGLGETMRPKIQSQPISDTIIEDFVVDRPTRQGKPKKDATERRTVLGTSLSPRTNSERAGRSGPARAFYGGTKMRAYIRRRYPRSSAATQPLRLFGLDARFRVKRAWDRA
jgi:hypothetical protein